MYKILFFLLLGSSLLFGQSDRPALVATEKIIKDSVGSVHAFSGTLAFTQKAGVAAEVGGKVISADFERGDSVSKGDTLVKIDTMLLNSQIQSQEAAVEVARVDFTKAQTDFERNSMLIDSDSIAQKTYQDSQFALQKAKANLQVAQSRLRHLRIQKEKTTLRAPFDGIVTEKNIAVGEWMGSGSSAASLVKAGSIEAIFHVPSQYADTLQAGKTYALEIGGKRVMAALHSKIPSGDAISRTFPVKFTLHTQDFVYAGMEAVAYLPRRQQASNLVVPRDAVINRLGGMVMFVVEKNKAKPVHVKVIGYGDTVVAVSGEGIKAGMDVVTKGNERIMPGQSVQIINR